MPNLYGTRILCVNANATLQTFLEMYLNSWGVETTCIQDGSTVLACLQEAYRDGHPYDAVILDHQTPGIDVLDFTHMIKSHPDLAALHLVLLTSFGQRRHRQEALRLGFAACLTKPVRHAHLAACVATAMGMGPMTQAAPHVPHPEPTEDDTALGLKVLVVEDNAINQKVAAIILEKFGCRVDLAANGRKALEATTRIAYDCIFMDCQMPEMDGFEATAVIRKREAQTGKHIPIIAMTANAMPSDRQRCLQAGMDGYLSKPVQAEELYAVLLPYKPEEMSEIETAPVNVTTRREDDMHDRLHYLQEEHGVELVAELIELFI